MARLFPRRYILKILKLVAALYMVSLVLYSLGGKLVKRSSKDVSMEIDIEKDEPAVKDTDTEKEEKNVPLKVPNVDDEALPEMFADYLQVQLPVAVDKKDDQQRKWADHEDDLVEQEHDLSRPGEMGIPIKIDTDALSPEDHKRWKDGWKNNAYNQYASDMMSLHRKLPEMRHPNCLKVKYQEVLPDTSVVICFVNEGWSVLLRTVHSVIDTTPRHLLREIILVDDNSDMDHLMEPLETYMAKLPTKVIIVRNAKREGLIRARIAGFKVATAETVTFLDSHCECAKGWIEPLLDRIATNESNVVCPVIDVINDDTFEYLPNLRLDRGADETVQVGGFNWGMIFTWHMIPAKQMKARKVDTDAIASPTMAGGLFTISRKYFIKLGLYDPGFDIWGGENLELSFKTWMCGGRLEFSPCSHIGHIFRKTNPYKTHGAKLGKNLGRLADVWLDEYKLNFFERQKVVEEFGDVSERKALRENLNCKSFDWYMKNIYPDAFLPHMASAKGMIKNKHTYTPTDMCLDATLGYGDTYKLVITYPCHNLGNNQLFYLSEHNKIRRDDMCVEYNATHIIQYPCHSQKSSQEWQHRNDDSIYHPASDLCLEMSGASGEKISMEACDSSNDRQGWVWKRQTPGLGTAVDSNNKELIE